MRKISVLLPSLGTKIEFEISRVQSNSAKYSSAVHGEVNQEENVLGPEGTVLCLGELNKNTLKFVLTLLRKFIQPERFLIQVQDA